MSAGRARGAASLFVVLAAACERSDEPELLRPEAAPPWLRDEARQRGLVFEHVSGFDGGYRMPEIMCGGAALFDLEGDGDLDAYLVQAGGWGAPAERPPNQLFVNDGAGHFRDATEGSGADDRGYGNGVACGDYDGDGRTDLYVTNLGPNVLLRNRGDGTFEDTTAAAGVGDVGWGTSATFADLDRDGDLDLYVCNYLEYEHRRETRCMNHLLGGRDYCSPLEYDAPAADVLYRNEGDGTFTDVSVPSGIAALKGNGLGVVAGDFDGDGRPDLFVANDGMPDRLWCGRGDWTFVDEALERGCALDSDGRAAAGMGVAAGDVDRDGDLDLLVCNLRNEADTFLRNQGTYFTNVTAVSGLGRVSRPFTRFGVGLYDFDNDGRLDLYQANGRVVRSADPHSADDLYAEPNLLFRSSDACRLVEVEPRGGTAEPLVATSRAAAFGDVDGDGGVDVLVVNKDAPAHLLINVAPDRGRWITLRVLECHGGPAIGAVLTVRAGDVVSRAEVRPGSSYQSSSAGAVHLGLGELEHVDAVEVAWSDGATQAFGSAGAGRVHTLRRGR